MYYPQIIKRYTVAMLNLFNNMSIPLFDKNGAYVKDIDVPIVFAQKDKNTKSNSLSTSMLIKGNNFTLPRAALSLTNIALPRDRDTSKHSILHQISTQRGRTAFTFNCISCDLTYSLYVLCKNFSEMTAIIENILPLFRPTYTLPVYEVSIQQEPTSIILQLDSQSINFDSEYDSEQMNYVSINLDFTLQGNLYLPIKDEKTITKMRLYINEESENEYRKSLLFYNIEALDETTFAEYKTSDENIASYMRQTEGAKSFFK